MQGLLACALAEPASICFAVQKVRLEVDYLSPVVARMIPVYWVTYEPETLARHYWDQSLVEDLLSGAAWRVPGGPTFGPHYTVTEPAGWEGVPVQPGEGGVVVIPARHNAKHIDQLNKDLARFAWMIVIGTGDEEAVFDWTKLEHPRRKVWAMTVPERGQAVDVPLGSGYSPGFPALLRDAAARSTPGRLDVFLAGQDTHERRHQAFKAAEHAAGRRMRLLRPTTQFLATTPDAGGLERSEYALAMLDTRFAPAPSGPESPDSFRIYEALEAGAIPIADGATPNGPAPGYWSYVFGGPVPFPIIGDWGGLHSVVFSLNAGWREQSAHVAAWWQQHKRGLAYKLTDAVHELGGTAPDYTTPDDQITVIVPTCPVNAHPDTTMIETVIDSVRVQLPTAEIIVVCDGVRPKMADRTADYHEHLRRLTRLCALRWDNVVPLILDEWGHQAGGTRAALELVTTPLILFVEHDTPLAAAPIDWDGLCDVVSTGVVNMVRLHHQTAIHPDHVHMMLDAGVPQRLGKTDARPDGVPLLRTFQWSQRPHLATTKFYRERIMPYFGVESRTYIEWIIHGAVQHGIEHGIEQQWQKWRVAIYYPDGGYLERSLHLDGRAGSSLEDAVWAYDGEPPPGAPPPTRKKQ